MFLFVLKMHMQAVTSALFLEIAKIQKQHELH